MFFACNKQLSISGTYRQYNQEGIGFGYSLKLNPDSIFKYHWGADLERDNGIGVYS